MKTNLIGILPIFVALQINLAFAQQLDFTYYKEAQGLKTELIKDITQDTLGGMWFATDMGLNYLHADKIEHFSDELPSRYIKSVLTTSSGRVLSTTDQGLIEIHPYGDPITFEVLYEGSNDEKESSKLSFPKMLFEDSKGIVWFSDNKAIYKYQNNAFETFKLAPKDKPQSFNRSVSFAEDGYGNLYGFTQKGSILQYKAREGTFRTIDTLKHGEEIHCVTAIDEGIILIGTNKGIIELMLYTNGTILNKRRIVSDLNISTISSSVYSGWYFGTWSQGLYFLSREKDEYTYLEINEPVINNINNIYTKGIEHGLWIATDQGIALTKSKTIKTIAPDLLNGYIQDCAAGDNNTIYIANKHTIASIDAERDNLPYKSVYQSIDWEIWQIAPDGEKLWIADNLGRIHSVQNGKATLKYDLSKQGQGIPELELDSHGNLWGTQDGSDDIFCISPKGEIQFFGKDKGIQSHITCIYEDKNQELYLGSQGDNSYLYKLNPKTKVFENISKPIPFKKNAGIIIEDISRDPLGTLWLGSYFGLLKYENNRLIRVSLGNMTNEDVKAIAVDQQGDLWLTNSQGLLKYSDGVPMIFNEKDGMSTKVTSYRTLIVDHENRIWAGTNNGVVLANNQYRYHTTPKPSLMYWELNGRQEALPQGKIRFSELSNAKFRFISPIYPLEFVKYQFRYAKEGAHLTAWKELASSDPIPFSNLEVGNYQLEVRAQHHGNYIWSDVTRVAFEVKRVWYLNWWAWLLFLGGFWTILGLTILWTSWQSKKYRERLERDVAETTQEVKVQKQKLEVQKRKLEIQNEQLAKVNEALSSAKQTAEEASQAKAHFLSNMSHEIRTPMNAVIGMTNILLAKELENHVREDVQIIKFAADNLLRLINDILDFSKIEAGKVSLENVDFSLPLLLKNLHKSMLMLAEKKNIYLKLDTDTSLPTNLIGDSLRISQILANLISNAIKFTEEGGVTIKVRGGNVQDGHVDVHFSIIDTGIGIPPHKLNMIFDSFTQASADTTRKFGGTGLGLAITKRLLELHGSRIQVESKVGEGSCFYFTMEIPISDKDTTAPEKARKLFSSLKGVNLLLVEDNAVNVLVAKKFLFKWDISVDVAVNGQEAVDKVLKKDYDIVLMDLQMPVMNGYEASISIRSQPEEKYKRLPIIALSASVLEEAQKKVLDSGMNSFVTKPFNPEDLYNVIASYSVSNTVELS